MPKVNRYTSKQAHAGDNPHITVYMDNHCVNVLKINRLNKSIKIYKPASGVVKREKTEMGMIDN